MRHIHVHLHPHGSSPAQAQDQTQAITPTKIPSTNPKRPPSTVIKPSPQSPHRQPSPNKAEVKPMKPAGVIKGQQGTSAPRPNAAAKGVRGVTSVLRAANRIASTNDLKDAGTSEGAKKAAITRKAHGGKLDSEHHQTIRKYLTKQGSYSGEGQGAHYRAAKQIAESDPSLKMEETVHPPTWSPYKRSGHGSKEGSYTKTVKTWRLRRGEQ